MAVNPVIKESALESRCEVVWTEGERVKQCGALALVKVLDVLVCPYCLHYLLRLRVLRRGDLTPEARATVSAFVGRGLHVEPSEACLAQPVSPASPGQPVSVPKRNG